jgi:uncharacterized protein YndB with AHSA1/START domain
MSQTRISQHVRASRAEVHRAITDPTAVQQWMVPDGMTMEIHSYDAREGGTFRISLTYQEPVYVGKTSGHTDTFHGRFVTLAPDRIVQTIEFESADPAMQGKMLTTFALVETETGTEIIATHANVPPGVRPEDNEQGWQMSLAKLARLVEKGSP